MPVVAMEGIEGIAVGCVSGAWLGAENELNPIDGTGCINCGEDTVGVIDITGAVRTDDIVGILGREPIIPNDSDPRFPNDPRVPKDPIDPTEVSDPMAPSWERDARFGVENEVVSAGCEKVG